MFFLGVMSVMEFTFSELRVTNFRVTYLQWEFWLSKAAEVTLKISFLKQKENEKFSSFAILENSKNPDFCWVSFSKSCNLNL